jgi:iron complex outermembrane recepter protein
MKPQFSLVAAAAIQCICSSPAWAQTSSTAALASAPASLATVVVTGNPLGNDSVVAPVDVLSGKDLQNRRAATLGETLNGLPGVSSTGFGPNASRPTIRGMEGDRIRILDNGGSMADASSLSDDHAVAIDPLTIERIEVLRGPAALLYGGSALGGVVNLQDNRISAQPLFDAKGGKSGQLDVSNGSTPGGHALSALLEAGTDRYTLHVDAFDRRSTNVPVREAVCEDASGSTFTSRRMCNSASASSGGAIGATLHFDQGHIGLAHSGLKMNYGTVAEPNVTIGLRSEKTRLAGEWQPKGSAIERIRWQLGSSDYRHTEFDDGTPATTFTQRAHDARVELHHTPVLGHTGVLGYQRDSGQFGADGAEAYAPYSRTRKEAWFLYEELPTSWGQLQWGGRLEDVRVTSLGNPAVARLNNAIGEKAFKPASTSLGALFALAGRPPPSSRSANVRPPTANCLPTARTPPPRPTRWATRTWASKNRAALIWG